MAREDVDIRARHRFADALARGVPVGAAAKAAGYSRQQGWNLRNDHAFMASVEKRRSELIGTQAKPTSVSEASRVRGGAGAPSGGEVSEGAPAATTEASKAAPVVGTSVPLAANSRLP